MTGSGLPEHMTWDRTPIAVTLAVGIERQVRFPKPVKVGVPAALQGVLRSQTAEGTVYWQARAPFETTRVLAKEIESGRTYLLDLKAVEGTGPATPIEVSPPAEQPREAVSEAAAPAEAVAPGFVDLTRYATQQLYAPARLLRDLPGVVRVPLRSVRSDRLLRGSEVEALPIAAWHSRNYYLTAVRLRNRTLHPLRAERREMEESITRRVTESLGREAQSKESEALGTLRRRIEELAARSKAPPPAPAPAADLPVGLGLEGAETLVWIEPLDGPANGGSLLHRAVDTVSAGTGALPSAPASTAERREPRPVQVSPVPDYTINRNATLIGSTAMAALIGRIPVKGRVLDPMPFKLIVGADNLAANGITIPGVAGMVASGIAVGDWTLACTTGDITSMSFVFQDGTLRTVSAGDPGQGDGTAGEERKRLGWISDERGVPCVSGERITDAPSFRSKGRRVSHVETPIDPYRRPHLD